MTEEEFRKLISDAYMQGASDAYETAAKVLETRAAGFGKVWHRIFQEEADRLRRLKPHRGGGI